jgi:hypothetical protein
MKDHPDINDTWRDEGIDGARRRHDGAQKFNGDLRREAPFGRASEGFRPSDSLDRRTPNLDNVPLAIEEWLKRDLPEPDFLMGEVLSTTSRILLNADTGLGKTNLTLALFSHIAAGRDFLHWRCPKPRNVLFVDGEMSRRLLRQRAQDAVRRLGVVPVGKFHLFSKEDVEGFPALNSDQGREALNSVIERVERKSGEPLAAISFDNVMSLLLGEMKEEEPWQQTLPLVWDLTRRNIGQLWIHHTGHDTSRGYGTKTREWGMDTVAHLTAAKRSDTDVSFVWKFTKARERTPLNRLDFQEVSIALINDQWIGSAAATGKMKVEPLATKFFEALRDATIGSATKMHDCPAASLGQWRAECVKRGLIDPKAKAHTARSMFSKYKLKLIAANWIACDTSTAWIIPWT